MEEEEGKLAFFVLFCSCSFSNKKKYVVSDSHSLSIRMYL